MLDEDVLNAFMARLVNELGASMQVATTLIGDELGLYRALDECGPAT
jgi:hypothetical protein